MTLPFALKLPKQENLRVAKNFSGHAGLPKGHEGAGNVSLAYDNDFRVTPLSNCY